MCVNWKAWYVCERELGGKIFWVPSSYLELIDGGGQSFQLTEKIYTIIEMTHEMPVILKKIYNNSVESDSIEKETYHRSASQ